MIRSRGTGPECGGFVLAYIFTVDLPGPPSSLVLGKSVTRLSLFRKLITFWTGHAFRPILSTLCRTAALDFWYSIPGDQRFELIDCRDYLLDRDNARLLELAASS